MAVLIPNFHASIHALFDQPNFPTVDHATPWLLLAPKLGHGAVAAGPGRIIGLILAVAVGALGVRYRADARHIVWLGALVLGLRCLFESVMDPYYVMAVVVLALVVASDLPVLRFAAVAAAGAGLTVLTYYRPEMWIYWGEMTAVMVTMLALAWRGAGRRSVDDNTEIETLPPLSADVLPSRARAAAGSARFPPESPSAGRPEVGLVDELHPEALAVPLRVFGQVDHTREMIRRAVHRQAAHRGGGRCSRPGRARR